jgi:hypothetical protein
MRTRPARSYSGPIEHAAVEMYAAIATNLRQHRVRAAQHSLRGQGERLAMAPSNITTIEHGGTWPDTRNLCWLAAGAGLRIRLSPQPRTTHGYPDDLRNWTEWDKQVLEHECRLRHVTNAGLYRTVLVDVEIRRRDQGISFTELGRRLGVDVGTVRRALLTEAHSPAAAYQWTLTIPSPRTVNTRTLFAICAAMGATIEAVDGRLPPTGWGGTTARAAAQ